MNLRRLLVPSPGAWLWLVMFLGILFSPRRAELFNDGDTSWHWLQGQWMLEHRAVLRADPFSHTRAGAALLCKDWGGDVLTALAGKLAGWSGLVFGAALLIATTLWLLYRQMRREGAPALWAATLTLLAAWVCTSHWLARPHLLTHLMVVVFAWKLRAFDAGRASARSAFAWLVPLTIVWTNVHSGFLTGFVLIGAFVAGNVARPSKAATFAALGAVCLLASLLNPFGWELHRHLIGFLGTPKLAFSTVEWQPPEFRSATTWGFAFLLAVIVATFVAGRKKLRGADVVLAGSWAILAALFSRNVSVFALVSIPIVAEHLPAAWQRSRVADRIAALEPATNGSVAVAAAILVAAGMLTSPALATELSPRAWPVAAARFARENPGRLRGEMFNEYTWGGYLMQALPERRVFIDGRNNFYGIELIGEYQRAALAQPGWEHVFDKYNVGWTILPRACRLNESLAALPSWKCEFADDTAVIYGRQL